MKLTTKQDLFVKAYIENGGNGTQAAIAAGYEEKSCREIASENLTKPAIKLALDNHRDNIARQHNVTAASLIEKLNRAYDMALELETVGPAVSAVSVMAKITGLDKQIIEHQGKIEHTMIEVEFITDNQIKDISE
jgi:phage terminase small subunit